MSRYIDADVLIDSLELMYEHRDDEDEPYNIGVRGAINMARKAPTIEPKRGEWIDISEWYTPRQKCSICETVIDGYGSNFCPNCGARMKGADDE